MRWILVYGLILLAWGPACTGKQSSRPGPSPSYSTYPDTPFSVKDSRELIGGPSAQGRVGDVVLANDQIRVVIQKPTKDAGIGSFGGTIIDADRIRMGGEVGNDNFGEFFPMVNVEWSINYYNYEVISDGSDGGSKILRAYGMIDTYDYIDVDWIADAASGVFGQSLSFPDRFDDRRTPFELQKELRGLSPEVITDYRLEPGSNWVRIDTTFQNFSDDPVVMPVGDFLVGGGRLEMLIPGLGFSPSTMLQAGGVTPAILFVGAEGIDVSYGYFHEFLSSKTSSLSYAGFTGVILGEEFLKILPPGSGLPPQINFKIDPKSSRTITRYFVVGTGDGGSLLDAGFEILKIPTGKIDGFVMSPGGAPIPNAIVAVKKQGGGTIVTYRTDLRGKFSGLLSKGTTPEAQIFGDGKYEVWVEKEGYHLNETNRAGRCEPEKIDLKLGDHQTVVCTLGETAVVKLGGGVKDELENPIAARLTIVGEDPSPETPEAGTFRDIGIHSHPTGIVDVKLINIQGGFGLTSQSSFEIEPGIYQFVFSHGPEYNIVTREVEATAGSQVSLENIVLTRVIPTPGFVSADFHIHASPSPDSAASVEQRALAAHADGLDVLQSSDHDFLTDYAPVVEKLVKRGIVHRDGIQTVVGDEITPNHYGHIHAFPLEVNPEDPDGGAIDWSAHPWDEVSPAPDYVLSPREIIEAVLLDPGEEVIQINHISDNPTGLPVASGWLTTFAYKDKFGLKPLMSYADPVERRLASSERGPAPPYSLGESNLVFTNFTAMELAIGSDFHRNLFLESALPTWFNILNLGLKVTATASSDSHHEVSNPLGLPRNYVASSVDPRDGIGGQSFLAIDEEEYAKNINAGRVVVSAGPFLKVEAKNEKGTSAGIGETLFGKQIHFTVEALSPGWAWFDSVEIYANTVPIPAEDSARFPMRGVAEDPASFAKPYHVPKYLYEPLKKFRVADGTLELKSAQNRLEAKVEFDLSFTEDSWVVILVQGTATTTGYRSLFPIVPAVLKDEKQAPKLFDPKKLSDFHKDPNVGASAWGLANPVFIDVDGDKNGDGDPFEAKYEIAK